MPKEDVNHRGLRIPNMPPPISKRSGVHLEGGVYIVVTRAFCPQGHDLAALDGAPCFDGFPGISLRVSDGKVEGIVALSPFHGDPSRVTEVDFPEGTALELCCPLCKTPLPTLTKCDCSGQGTLVLMYLTPELTESRSLAVCNVWGCRRSQIVDQFQLISEFIEREEEELGRA